MAQKKTPECPFGDPFCPCQDGDACHYVAYPWESGITPMQPPQDQSTSEDAYTCPSKGMADRKPSE